MDRLVRKVKRGEGGFTLIELVIVIVILGILAAVVVFAVSGINDRGTLSACKADVKSIDVAAETYFAQKGTAAPTLNDLVNGGFLHKDAQINAAGTQKVTHELHDHMGTGERAGQPRRERGHDDPERLPVIPTSAGTALGWSTRAVLRAGQPVLLGRARSDG